MYCRNCGAEISDKAVVCMKCGCPVNGTAPINNWNGSSKDWLVTLLLCLFAGGLGIHRFYVGKIGTAIIQLLTAGGFGIWALIDLIVICMGNFTDAEGKLIKDKR